jgi:hypothetical protein
MGRMGRWARLKIFDCCGCDRFVAWFAVPAGGLFGNSGHRRGTCLPHPLSLL